MKIACIGGGPAGLYLGILVKRVAPEHDVVVYERNRPADTFGFGVVFSDATLGHLAAADPETHRQITDRFARWDDIEIHVGGEVLRSTGHGFCGIERKALLQLLQARAQELGVRIEFEREVRALGELSGADVIVACDGVASWVRDALAAELRPHVDVRPNKFVWLGCTVPYRAFTFLFKETPHGLFRVHAYRYHEHGSTFIAECREETWRALGLAGADEDRTLAVLEGVFAEELAGHRLIKNRSIWRNFPTVRCGKWHAGNVVLVGDAAHTAHFSIGSGTKLAMEDVIALRDELVARGARDIGGALAAYEARRRPEVEALQAAAQASLEWFEGTERYLAMAPVQLTYSLMTRSLRVSHASVARRDPHLARGVEALLARAAGVPAEAPPRPTALPLQLGDRRARSRLALAEPAAALVDAAADTLATADTEADADAEAAAWAGLVVTRPALGAEAAAAWEPAIAAAHAAGALIALRLIAPVPDDDEIARAAAAGFDLLLLDPGGDPELAEQLPALVQRARGAWRPGGWIAAVVEDRPATRAAAVGYAAQLARAGADLLWVRSPAAGSAPPAVAAAATAAAATAATAAAATIAAAALAGSRLPPAPLADRLRNELSVATCIEVEAASLPDLDAAIAAGRADLVAVSRPPDETHP
ncbi:MAG TPA: FAD-dependent monooxygenase [Kofleriaceae bacterium]|nr:FAD-dependent monooxygenase [Kofleriaceae bacterium]